MEAPKCQKIPSCGKRHYGDCGSAATGERPDGSSRKARPKKKSKLVERLAAAPKPADQAQEHAEITAHVLPLAERVEVLETIVYELLSGKRRRSEYMKQYMRDKRAEEKL